jgi:hypothetical protein
MAKTREPTDDDLLEFMRPSSRQTFENPESAPRDKARIRQGAKKLWKAAQNPATDSPQSPPPPLEWSSEVKNKQIAGQQMVNNAFQQAKPPKQFSSEGAEPAREISYEDRVKALWQDIQRRLEMGIYTEVQAANMWAAASAHLESKRPKSESKDRPIDYERYARVQRVQRAHKLNQTPDPEDVWRLWADGKESNNQLKEKLRDKNTSERSRRSMAEPHWFETVVGDARLWGLVAVIALAIAFSRRSANSDLAVWVLLLIAAILGILIVNTHRTVRSGRHRRLLTALSIAAATLLAIASGWWLTTPVAPVPTTPNSSSSAAIAPPATPSASSVTLRQLFDSEMEATPSRPIAKQTIWTVKLNDFPDQPIPVIVRVLIEREARVEFLACYIPLTDHTYRTIELLTNEYPKILEYWKDVGISQSPKGERPVDLDNLKFSGSVFVYYELRLRQAEIDKLSVEYREKGLEPTFRGPEYRIAKANAATPSP